MTSPSLELQGAIVSRLKSFAPVTAVVGSRVYDVVPSEAAFPYVSLGPADETSDDADCLTGFEVSLQVDCWSRAVGFPEVKALCDAVRQALHNYEPSLSSNALVSLTHRQTRVFRDSDGLTSHAAMTFEAIVEQP